MKPTRKQILEAARILGAVGGSKGGKARARALSPERRREIATIAGRASGIARGKGPGEETSSEGGA